MLNKTIKIIDKSLNFVMLIFCLLLLLIGGYAVYDSYLVYDDTSLDDEIISLRPKNDGAFKLDKLQKLNPDIEGWLTVFETTIDYPVLHSSNNLDYLNAKYDGSFTSGGSIFSDYRNEFGFLDDYTILYGHNMTTGQMFSDIKKYENREFFEQHLYGAIHTNEETYKLEIIYVAHVNAYHDDIYNLITYANGKNDELMGLVQNRAVQFNPVDDFSKLVLLSTCDSYGSNDRMVLLAKLSPTDDGEITNISNETKEKAVSSREATGDTNNYFSARYFIIYVLIIIVIISVVILCKSIVLLYKKSKKNQQ